MGELRDRMQGDMVLRGLRETTQRAYLDCAQKFAAYYRRSPAELGAKEIREYLLYLLEERELRPSSIGPKTSPGWSARSAVSVFLRCSRQARWSCC